jgi:adenylate kinase family enzyme
LVIIGQGGDFLKSTAASLARPYLQKKPVIASSVGDKWRMERIIIIGSSGSGKSTLARAISGRTGLPVIHLDQYYWRPGWVASDEAVWQQCVQTLIQQPRWIMDGNYRETLDLRLAAAHMVLFLDLPRWVCTWQAIRRRVQYRQQQRPDMAPGCQETLFGPDFPEFLLRIWHYPRRARPDVLYRLARLNGYLPVVHLRSRQEMCHFIANLEQTQMLTGSSVVDSISSLQSPF